VTGFTTLGKGNSAGVGFCGFCSFKRNRDYILRKDLLDWREKVTKSILLCSSELWAISFVYRDTRGATVLNTATWEIGSRAKLLWYRALTHVLAFFQALSLYT